MRAFLELTGGVGAGSVREGNGLEGKVELEVCERKMGATQFSLDGSFTINTGNNNPALVRGLDWRMINTSKNPSHSPSSLQSITTLSILLKGRKAVHL